LTLLGTSHIAQQSIKEINLAVEKDKPDIIAVELDLQRANALMNEEQGKASVRDISKIGFKGYMFVKIGHYVQQKLGKSVGIAPGTEMKTAIQLAKQHQLQLALIDQPIQITLKRFSKELTWKEKGRFIADIFKGLFFPKRQLKKLGNFDLQKVPEQELIHTLITELKDRYPSIYKTLIEERNKYMVKQLIKLLRAHPEKKILAVVGAGHLAGMQELLLKVDIVKQ